MTKDVGILILGLLVAATPYLGFPASYERLIFVVAGLLIAILAFLIRGDFSLFSIEERTGDTFVENGSEHREVVSDGVMTEGTDTQHEGHQETH